MIHVDIDGDQARKADQWDMGSRIRAVDQGPRGEVYLLEDGPGGRLLRLKPGSDAAVAQVIGPPAFAARLGAVARLDPAAGRLEEVLGPLGEPFELVRGGAA